MIRSSSPGWLLRRACSRVSICGGSPGGLIEDSFVIPLTIGNVPNVVTRRRTIVELELVCFSPLLCRDSFGGFFSNLPEAIGRAAA